MLGEALVASAASTHTLRKQSNWALSPHNQSVSRVSPFAHSSLHSSPQAILNRTHQFLKCQLRSSLHLKVDKSENTHRLLEHAE